MKINKTAIHPDAILTTGKRPNCLSAVKRALFYSDCILVMVNVNDDDILKLLNTVYQFYDNSLYYKINR